MTRPVPPAESTPTPDETLPLLRAWQDHGDRDALGQLLDRNFEFVRAVVRKRLGPLLRDDVQSLDLVQEVALDALEYGPRFRVTTRAQLRALLARMVENNIRDRGRYRNAQKRDLRRQQPMTTSIDLSASITRPDHRVEKAELRELVRLAVDLLGDEDRRIVRLHQLEGRPMNEVAETLGLKPQTAHMRFQRALPRLAAQVQRLMRGELPTVD